MSTFSSTSSSTLISTLYNSIRPPPLPKCSTCTNEQPERQLQRHQGTNYFFIPDRHVDVFVCTFCKKLDEPKCTYCWDSKPCCTHRQKTLFESYFKTIKQEIIKTAQSIVETYKGYEKRSTDDLSLTMGNSISLETIKKDLTLHFYNVQEKVKKDVEDQMSKNYQELYNSYKNFEQDMKSRLNPQLSTKNTNIERKEVGFSISSSKMSVSLAECLRWLNELENRREQINKTGREVCEKYIERVSVDYPKVLFKKLSDAFRTVLLPKVTFKDSMIQTVGQISGNSKPVGSERNIRQRKQENAGPQLTDEKIDELQKVIQKDRESILKLQERMKQLQFILNVEQQKNQDLQVMVFELEKRCGISHDEKEISIIEKIQGKKMNQNKPYDFKSLKASRSNPNFILSQSEIIVRGQSGSTAEKRDESKGNTKIEEKLEKRQEEKESKNVKMNSRKITEQKGKGTLENSAWLEEVVNEIKE